MRKTLRVVDLACAALVSGVILAFSRGFYHDDAYIALRYAKNLIGGLEGTLFSFFVLAGCLLFMLPPDSHDGWWLYAASGTLLGLNDAHIARRRIDEIEQPLQRLPGHAKGDGAYVLSGRPHFIIAGPAKGNVLSKKPWFLSDLEISRDPLFERDYTLVQVLLDLSGRRTEQRGVIFTYYRRTASQ